MRQRLLAWQWRAGDRHRDARGHDGRRCPGRHGRVRAAPGTRPPARGGDADAVRRRRRLRHHFRAHSL